MTNYRDVDENAKRFVLILNRKESNLGRLLNAAGHMFAGLVGKVLEDEDFVFVDYVDSEGNVHPAISHFPVIALSARNSGQIRKIRLQADAIGLRYVDFTTSMTIGSTEEQLNETANLKEEDLEYLGICLFGQTEVLRGLTSKLSLFR